MYCSKCQGHVLIYVKRVGGSDSPDKNEKRTIPRWEYYCKPCGKYLGYDKIQE